MFASPRTSYLPISVRRDGKIAWLDTRSTRIKSFAYCPHLPFSSLASPLFIPICVPKITLHRYHILIPHFLHWSIFRTSKLLIGIQFVDPGCVKGSQSNSKQCSIARNLGQLNSTCEATLLGTESISSCCVEATTYTCFRNRVTMESITISL